MKADDRLQRLTERRELHEGPLDKKVDFGLSTGKSKQAAGLVEKHAKELSAAVARGDAFALLNGMTKIAKALGDLGWSVNDGGPLEKAWKPALQTLGRINLDREGNLR